MQIYYCWITTEYESYKDDIIAGLATKGYMVGAASKIDKVCSEPLENGAATVIGISLYHAKEVNVNDIYRDVIDILANMKARFYSVIVSHSYEATWVGSNILNDKAKDTV